MSPDIGAAAPGPGPAGALDVQTWPVQMRRAPGFRVESWRRGAREAVTAELFRHSTTAGCRWVAERARAAPSAHGRDACGAVKCWMAAAPSEARYDDVLRRRRRWAVHHSRWRAPWSATRGSYRESKEERATVRNLLQSCYRSHDPARGAAATATCTWAEAKCDLKPGHQLVNRSAVFEERDDFEVEDQKKKTG